MEYYINYLMYDLSVQPLLSPTLLIVEESLMASCVSGPELALHCWFFPRHADWHGIGCLVGFSRLCDWITHHWVFLINYFETYLALEIQKRVLLIVSKPLPGFLVLECSLLVVFVGISLYTKCRDSASGRIESEMYWVDAVVWSRLAIYCPLGKRHCWWYSFSLSTVLLALHDSFWLLL